MTPAEPAPSNLDLDTLLGYRESTERIAAFLHKRLKDHLQALSPLLSPARVFGKQGGRADEAIAEVTKKFHEVRASLSFLIPEIDEDTITSLNAAVQLHPFEYTHEAQSTKGSRPVAMTAPVRWVASFGTEYSLAQVRAHLSSEGERRPLPVRQFIVSALAFQTVLSRSTAAASLLRDLRYSASTQSTPGWEAMPVSVLAIEIPSFRPPDELLLTATRLSGVPSFIELIQPEAIASFADPLRKQLEELA
jgi:hypothetical protein